MVYASSINEMETYEYLQSDDIEPAGGYIYGTGKLAAHLMGETVAKINGIEFIPVIITNIYGVGEKSARMIYTSINKLVHKEHCSFTAGYQTYDFIYITDAINSIIAVAENVDNLWGDPTKAKTVLGWNPQKTSYEQLVEIMAKHDRKCNLIGMVMNRLPTLSIH